MVACEVASRRNPRFFIDWHCGRLSSLTRWDVTISVWGLPHTVVKTAVWKQSFECVVEASKRDLSVRPL